MSSNCVLWDQAYNLEKVVNFTWEQRDVVYEQQTLAIKKLTNKLYKLMMFVTQTFHDIYQKHIFSTILIKCTSYLYKSSVNILE